jgi:hypothetical protein
MTKPVTPQEMFDMWQKMVNPGGYPVQSLMFPILDKKEIDRKIAELETVEHWLVANINMLKMSIKSLQYQKAMLEGGEKVQKAMQEGGDEGGEIQNPALWAWNMMAQASKDVMEQVSKQAAESQAAKAAKAGPTPKRKKKPS